MPESVWIILAVTVYFNLRYDSWMSKLRFLSRKLFKDVCEIQPGGFVDPENARKGMQTSASYLRTEASITELESSL